MGIYKDRNSLEGRVGVVTGGAGILGSETSSALADAGSKVAVVDLDESAAKAHANVLSEKYGVQALGIRCDVTDEASIADMITQVESELGPIDILHNNAATKGSDLKKVFAPLDEFSMETWAEIMRVNVDGLFAVARAVGVGMAKRNRGSIVQTASIYGAFMGPDQRIYEGSNYLGGPINTPPVYSASKAAVHGLTLYLATYWASQGVRVNTISPGGISSGQNGIFHDKYSARVPMGRMAQAHEVASGVLFLASDAASYVTGQNLFVDGGLSAW